jgi:phosphate transport system substrate-binding protein
MNCTTAFYKIVKLSSGQQKIDIGKMFTDSEYQLAVLTEAALSPNQELSSLANSLMNTSGIDKKELKPGTGVDIENGLPLLDDTTKDDSEIRPKNTERVKSKKRTPALFFCLSFSVIAVLTLLIYLAVAQPQKIDSVLETLISTTSIVTGNSIEKGSEPDYTSVADTKGNAMPINFPVANETEYQLAFRLHGSNTVGEHLAPMLLKGYFKKNKAKKVVLEKSQIAAENSLKVMYRDKRDPVKVEIHAHGSSTGFKDLLSGKTDMSMSSRKINTKETLKLEPLYGKLNTLNTEHIVALDGLAIIIHPSNPISRLTTKQLSQLFSGKISDWADIGGNPGPVTIYARDSNSGTWDSFKSMVLKKHKVELSAVTNRYESSTELSRQVSNDPQAIGFIGLPYVLNSKVLAISDDSNTVAFFPTPFTVATEDYPLSRRLYMYTPERTSTQEIRNFLKFTLSKQGQRIVTKAGFISQNLTTVKPAADPSFPKEYLSLLGKAERLSLSFRFLTGSYQLENKGQNDILRIVEYLSKHPMKKLILAGFSDNQGNLEHNLYLSKLRARTVSQLLENYGISPQKIIGFGAAAPIATNDSDYGRYKNRRVEAWVM